MLNRSSSVYHSGIAIVAFFVLPNFPRTTSWLTEEERQLAVWRLDEDIGEDDWISSEAQTFGHGLKLAVVDIKMWILVSAMEPRIRVCPSYVVLNSSRWL
jgi:hypothetical protein